MIAAPNTTISDGLWLTVSVAPGSSTPKPATAQAIPRWNRPVSEYGHGSTSRLISRPRSEAVQASLTGQLLHTDGVPR